MKILKLTFATCFVLSAVAGYAQCRADSVFSYAVIGGVNSIVSIEYFQFDEKDSMTGSNLVQINEGVASPLNAIAVRYYKSKAGMCTERKTSVWNPERGLYRPESIHTVIYSKKGLLLTERYEKIETEVVPELEIRHTYNKSGELVKKEFVRWNGNLKQWETESWLDFSYTNGNQTLAENHTFDTADNTWKADWKILFSYDSLNEISESVTYEYKNDAWVPKSRTVYGKEADKPIKWNIVQEWNGSKEMWSNEFYYVFQMNEKGFTTTEVHLSWGGKEWKIDGSYNYVYNESGYLIQVLNDSKQVLMERFCHL